MRALTQNVEGARLVGIDRRTAAFAILLVSGALVGVAAVLLGPVYFVSYNNGLQPMIKGLTVALLGGLGSVRGTIVAGGIVAFVEATTATYIGAEDVLVSLFLLIAVVLLVRPRGISGILETTRASDLRPRLLARRVVAAIVLPPLYDDSYVMAELVLFGIYFSINLMWSLVLGTAGLYSFATPAFVGAAAYTCAWLSLNHGLPWWLYAPIGLAVGAVCGLLVALPAVRLRGVYFALLTIGLVEACNQYVTADTENLGGAQGLVGSDSIIPPSKQGLVEGYYYAYAAIGVIAVVALLVYWWVSSGRLGLRLRTARESETVAEALGIDIPRARLAVFVITAAVLGLVGAFRASYDAGANKSVFDFSTLLLLFAMIVVGGINSAKGILIGTALLQYIEQHFVSWGAPRLVLLGVIMLTITLFSTDGIAGLPDQISPGAAEPPRPVIRPAGRSGAGRRGEP